MESSVSCISTKHFDRTNIGWWFWMLKKSNLIRGFQIRFLGIHMHVQERNGFAKSIIKAKQIIKIKEAELTASFTLKKNATKCKYETL